MAYPYGGINAVALGTSAGLTNQSTSAVAIGYNAGVTNQGLNAVAIGAYAGQSNQPASSIVINATGVALTGTTASSLYVAPIRNTPGSTLITYNSLTNEVVYSNTLGGTITATGLNYSTLVGSSITASSLQVNSTINASSITFMNLMGSILNASTIGVNSTLTASTINFTNLTGATANVSTIGVNSTLTASSINFTNLTGATANVSTIGVNSTLTASSILFTNLTGAIMNASTIGVNSTLTASTISFTSLTGSTMAGSTLTIASSIVTSSLTYSTLQGSTLFANALVASTLTASTLNVPGFSLTTFSTLTGSTLTASSINASTIGYSTMQGSTLFANMFTASTLTASTLNVPGFSLTTFSTLNGSTLTASTINASTINYSTMAGSTIYVTTMSVSSLTFSTVNGSGGGGIGAGQVAAIFMTPNAATTIPSNTSTIVTWGNLSNSAQNTGQTGLTYISSGGLAGSFANQTGAPIFTLVEYTLYLTAAGTNFTYIGLYQTSTPTSIVAYGAMYPSSNWLKNSFMVGVPAGYSIAVFYQDNTSTTVQIANTTISISNIGTSGATGATGPQGAVGMASYLFGTGATGGATGATGPINTPTIIPWSNTFVAQSLSGITGLTYANGVFTNNSLAAMPLHIAYNLLLNQTGSGTTYVGINGGTNPQDTYGVQLTTVNAYSNGCTILLAVGSSFAVYHTDTVPFVVQQYASKINVTLLSVGPQGQTGYTGTTGPTGPIGQVTVLSVYPTTTQSITANTPTTLLWGSTNNSQTLGIMGLTYNAGLFTNNTGITIPLLLEYTIALNTTASGAIHVGINGGTNAFGAMLTTANIFSGSATVLLPAGQTVGLYYTDANAVTVQTGTPPSQLTQLSISLLTAGPMGSTGYTGTTGPTGPNSWTTNGLNLSYTAGMVTASTFTASTIQSGQETTSSIRLTSTVISLGQSTNTNYYNLAQSAVGSTFGSTLTTTSWGSTLNTLTNVRNASMVGAGNYQMVTTGTSTLNSVWLTANNGSSWSTISQATGLPSSVSTIYTYGSVCSLGIYSLLATTMPTGGNLYLSNNTATSFSPLYSLTPYIQLPFESSLTDLKGIITPSTIGSVSYVTGIVGSNAVYLANDTQVSAGSNVVNYVVYSGYNLAASANISVTGWFNFHVLPASTKVSNIFTIGNGTAVGAPFQLSYYNNAGGYTGLLLMIYNGSASTYITSGTGLSISINTWYNFTIIYQPAGLTSLYVNNQLIGTASSTGNLGVTPTLVTLATSYNSLVGVNGFSGYIDDLRIYNSAITFNPILPMNYNLTAISGNAQYMLAAANGAGLFMSSNFGSTWSQVASATPNGAWTGLAISYTGQYMVAISQTASNAPIYSTNYGSNWTQTSFTGVTGSFVAISGNGQYCLAGSTTVAFLISNYLAGFSTSAYTQPTLTGINANIVAASLSTTGQYMVIVTAGTTNNVYFSINYGATFTVITVGAAALVSCTMSYDGSYITVANATTVYTLNQNSNGYTVAVGANAGLTNQAINAIAIGNNAGTINQTANSIILNAQGTALNSYAQGFYVAPIASALASNSATYNVLAYGGDNQVVQNTGFVVTNAGYVGIGTSAPQYTLDLTGTANLGNALSTVYNSMGYTAASLAAIALGNGSVSGPVGGVYTFTYNGAGNDFIIYNMFPPNSMIQVSITASSPNGITFQIGPDSVTAYYISPVLTNTFTTYTFTAKTTSSGTLFMHVSNGTSGYMLKWNAFSVNRLDTSLTGNVGIGITNPQSILSVKLGGAGINNTAAWTSGDYAIFGPNVSASTSAAVALTYNTANDYGALLSLSPSIAWKPMYYAAASHNFIYGNVGIGTNVIYSILHVKGTQGYNTVNGLLTLVNTNAVSSEWSCGPNASGTFAIINGGGNQGVTMASTATAWSGYSDERLKRDISSISSGLSSILNLRPVYYNYKTDNQSEIPRSGFIAQEVDTIFPRDTHWVITENTIEDHVDDDGNKYKSLSLSMTELIPYIVKGVQEQNALITSLQSTVSQQATQLTQQATQLTQQADQIAQLTARLNAANL